jgi:hypothetical protein
MNYAETLAYWYLRLNGFFPLRDFVLHKGEEVPHTSDCDLLAIRFPHVYEEVGGQTGDWDTERFQAWGLDLGKPVALIVQVKARTRSTDDGAAFSTEYLKAALRRTGLWDGAVVDGLLRDLATAPHGAAGSTQVAKLLIASNPSRNDARYLRLDLKDTLRFIQKRFHDYQSQKMAGRFMFHDELIQFLASAEARP